MPKKQLNSKKQIHGFDWFGNNAAFTCPVCGKIFIASEYISKNGRACPKCGKATAYCTGKPGKGEAFIEW